MTANPSRLQLLSKARSQNVQCDSKSHCIQSLQQGCRVHLPFCYAPFLAGSEEGKAAAAAVAAGQCCYADDAILVWAALLPASAASAGARVSSCPSPCRRGCSAAGGRRCCCLLFKQFDASRQGGGLGSALGTAAAGRRHSCRHKQGHIRAVKFKHSCAMCLANPAQLLLLPAAACPALTLQAACILPLPVCWSSHKQEGVAVKAPGSQHAV